MEFVGSILIFIGLPTALIDMGMNGSQYADWAPYGLVMTLIGCYFVS